MGVDQKIAIFYNMIYDHLLRPFHYLPKDDRQKQSPNDSCVVSGPFQTRVPLLLPWQPVDGPANNIEHGLTSWHCHVRQISKAVQKTLLRTARQNLAYYFKSNVELIRQAFQRRIRCLTNMNLTRVSLDCQSNSVHSALRF